VVSTLAGAAWNTDGVGTATSFNFPFGVASDGVNLYVADTNNNTIRKIVIATGAVSTLAGAANNYGSADGTGAAALFNSPSGITSDGVNLYVTDTNNFTIRKIVIGTGVVTTLAGTVGLQIAKDGTALNATFNYPQGITTDGLGNLYVVDTYDQTIRKIVISTGVVSTLAGSSGAPGWTDATGPAAQFSNPQGITSDGTNLYVTDSNNFTIRKIVITTREVSTLAGTAGAVGSTDATGAAASFNNPQGITTDGTNLYVADSNNSTIRKIVITSGMVSTIAGTALAAGSADGTGSLARFNTPVGITSDGASLYVTDSSSNTIRKIQ
jgi:sugar lactone lactonase YvrE